MAILAVVIAIMKNTVKMPKKSVFVFLLLLQLLAMLSTKM